MFELRCATVPGFPLGKETDLIHAGLAVSVASI